MKAPYDYEKRILLTTSGKTPQIVTETLYALAVNNPQPFIPTEIHLVTTTSGAERAFLQLLHSKDGKFHQLCRDYGLENIYFPQDNIHVISDETGKLLEDIITPAQNEIAADFITDLVSRLTRDEDAALHVSIAGGRKTMGYYLGYALSLYGRKQDRLSHVLVTDLYENLPEFFYPTPDSQVIYTRDKQPLDAQKAQVMLAQIPFVRLIDGNVPLFLQQEKAGFSDSVRMAQALEDEALLQINEKADKNRRVLVSELALPIPLTDVNFAFYLWVLNRSQNGEAVQRKLTIKPNLDYAAEFLDVYQQCVSEMRVSDKVAEGLEKGMEEMFVSDRVTAVNDAFVSALGKRAAQDYLIQKRGKRGNISYEVRLSEEQVQFL